MDRTGPVQLRILLVLSADLSGGKLMTVRGHFRSDNAGPVIGLVVYSRADLGDVVGMIGAEVLAKTLSDTGVIEELLLLPEEAGLFD